MWKELLNRPDLSAMDFVCEDAGGVYRGPVKELLLNTVTEIFTIRTSWVAKYNSVTMRWVRWLPSPTGEYGIEILTENCTVQYSSVMHFEDGTSAPVSGAHLQFRSIKDDKCFACLVPHVVSKLHREDLV